MPPSAPGDLLGCERITHGHRDVSGLRFTGDEFHDRTPDALIAPPGTGSGDRRAAQGASAFGPRSVPAIVSETPHLAGKPFGHAATPGRDCSSARP